MFNEILTGAASNEAKAPPDATPYREPGVLPPETLTCVTCIAKYSAPAGSLPGQCPKCRVELMEMNARNDALAFQLAEADAQRKANSHKLFAIITTLVVAAGIGVFKYGMRSAKRDDYAKAAGYVDYDDYKTKAAAAELAPSDDYSRRIQAMARELCACTDLKCARDVKAAYVYYVRSHMAPDDDAEKSVAKSTDELYACMNAFEAAATR